jgi:dUTPase
MRPEVGVLRLEHGRDLPLPAYETTGAAGMDLRAAWRSPCRPAMKRRCGLDRDSRYATA